MVAMCIVMASSRSLTQAVVARKHSPHKEK